MTAATTSTGGDSFDDVPLTREDVLSRDSSQEDDLPARADGDVARAERADPADGA